MDVAVVVAYLVAMIAFGFWGKRRARTESDFLVAGRRLGPLLYAGENQENWPLSLALASFRGSHQVEWNLTMAATVLIMAPAIVLFLFAQKSFVKGITFTGVKG